MVLLTCLCFCKFVRNIWFGTASTASCVSALSLIPCVMCSFRLFWIVVRSPLVKVFKSVPPSVSMNVLFERLRGLQLSYSMVGALQYIPYRWAHIVHCRFNFKICLLFQQSFLISLENGLFAYIYAFRFPHECLSACIAFRHFIVLLRPILFWVQRMRSCFTKILKTVFVAILTSLLAPCIYF